MVATIDRARVGTWIWWSLAKLPVVATVTRADTIHAHAFVATQWSASIDFARRILAVSAMEVVCAIACATIRCSAIAIAAAKRRVATVQSHFAVILDVAIVARTMPVDRAVAVPTAERLAFAAVRRDVTVRINPSRGTNAVCTNIERSRWFS